jgi:cyclase
VDDLSIAINDCGASAVAAGSMFVFHGKHRAVLISYPEQSDLDRIFHHH